MKLYFSPLACSLATRISFYEAGANAEFVEVDPKTKKTLDGRDFLSVTSLGLVPVLDVEGDLLLENAAILQHVAERLPEAQLAPTDLLGRARLQQWLCFIGTELHKGLFTPLLDKKAPQDAKAYALSKADARLTWLDEKLAGREFLLDRFSVADAYLFTILNWTFVTPVELKKFPAIFEYYTRLSKRPSIARAFAEERELYAKELARHAAA
ncbi:MAG: glutathione S-transferase [Polyangiaceae bacterium]|nr:glutathione S-transferase [Polyangiaceae bacterium]